MAPDATEDVPFNALYNSLGQLTSFTAVGTNPLFQWGHTYGEWRSDSCFHGGEAPYHPVPQA